MSYYLADLIYILSAGNKYLTVDRSNLLLRELPLIQGSNNNPSLCFQGDERTGIWNNAEGETTTTSLGSNSFTVTRYGFKSWDRFGKSILFDKQGLSANRTIYFPDADGTVALETQIVRQNNESVDTIFRGMAVKVDTDTGVVKALGDAEGNYAIGLSKDEPEPTGYLQVVYKDYLTLSDWTEATGSSTLTVGARYYLHNSTSGIITVAGVDASPQLIGIAISDTTLLLRLS